MDTFTPLSYEDTIKTLDLIKIDKHHTEPLIKRWISQILKPPSSIITQIVKEIFSPKTTDKTIERNYSLIMKLLIICHNDTAKRICESNGLSCDIINYIAYTTKSVICQDSLTILNVVFQAEEIKYYLTEKFVVTIFDLLNTINDEVNFKSAIQILISVNSIFDPCDDNYFLKVYHVHINSRFFDEAILRMLNNESKPIKIKEILDCIVLIIECEQKIVFYSSDLEVFIDIAIRQLQVISDEEVRYRFINALYKFVSFEEYYKKMYKSDEIIDLIKDCLDNENQSQKVKRKCRGIIKTINRHSYDKEDNEDNQSYNEEETNNSNLELSFENEENEANNPIICINDVSI